MLSRLLSGFSFEGCLKQNQSALETHFCAVVDALGVVLAIHGDRSGALFKSS